MCAACADNKQREPQNDYPPGSLVLAKIDGRWERAIVKDVLRDGRTIVVRRVCDSTEHRVPRSRIKDIPRKDAVTYAGGVASVDRQVLRERLLEAKQHDEALLCSFPKEVPPGRCRPYLDWLKAMPCANPHCSAHHVDGTSDPDHQRDPEAVEAVGAKPSDFSCINLCRICHRVRTDTGMIPGMNRTETDAFVWKARARLLMRWCDLVWRTP